VFLAAARLGTPSFARVADSLPLLAVIMVAAVNYTSRVSSCNLRQPQRLEVTSASMGAFTSH